MAGKIQQQYVSRLRVLRHLRKGRHDVGFGRLAAVVFRVRGEQAKVNILAAEEVTRPNLQPGHHALGVMRRILEVHRAVTGKGRGADHNAVELRFVVGSYVVGGCGAL